MNDFFPLYVTDDAKGTVSVTVKDQHLRGDNGLIDVQWRLPGAKTSQSTWAEFVDQHQRDA